MKQKLVLIASIFPLMFGIAKDTRCQWIKLNGNHADSVWCFGIGGSNLYAALETTGILRSTDDGTSWTPVGSTIHYVSAIAVIGSSVFAGSFGDGGVYRSTDNGASWVAVGPVDSLYDNWALAVSGTNLFAGNINTVFRSSDNGTNWVPANVGLPDKGYEVQAFAVSGSNLFVTGNGAGRPGVYRSTNNGQSWDSVSGLAGSKCFAVKGTNLFAARGDSVFLSTDNGINWSGSNTGLPTTYPYGYVTSFAVSDSNLFAGTDSGVFLSTNSGSSWIPEGLMGRGVIDITVSGRYLIAGTDTITPFSGVFGGYGIWRRPLSEMIGPSAVKESGVALNEIRSYPNPFSQSTTITFTPQSGGYAEVSIFNQLGVEVARLFSGELDAGEQHTFTWNNPATLSDGVYECLIRMNGQVEKLPMVLMR